MKIMLLLILLFANGCGQTVVFVIPPYSNYDTQDCEVDRIDLTALPEGAVESDTYESDGLIGTKRVIRFNNQDIRIVVLPVVGEPRRFLTPLQ